MARKRGYSGRPKTLSTAHRCTSSTCEQLSIAPHAVESRAYRGFGARDMVQTVGPSPSSANMELTQKPLPLLAAP